MYRIFDIALDSDIHLPELPYTDGADQVVVVRSSKGAVGSLDQAVWVHEWKTPGGEVCIASATISGGYVVRFPELADFLVRPSDGRIDYLAPETTPAATIRHLLVDQVVPRLLGQQGRLVIHASAVTLSPGRVAAFVGDSGWGKSTIASSFYQSGAGLVTDDCLLLEASADRVSAVGNYHGLRLFEDSSAAIFGPRQEFTEFAHYSDKKRLLLGRVDADSVEGPAKTDLAAIFLLADPLGQAPRETVEVEVIKGAVELMTLIRQMFLLDVTDKQAVARQFRNIGKIIDAGIPVYQLRCRREHGQLQLLREAVLQVMQRDAA